MPRSPAAADPFYAIADPTRRQLLSLLRDGERNVGSLACQFSISLPAVSQHLRILRHAGLVRVRRDGRERFYRLDPEPLEEVADWVEHFARFWPERLRALERFLEGCEWHDR